MDMNERKIKILEAIIHDYIQTGDPVGSRTISKKYDLGISSATIRNEMSDLEELGLIVQPHTSSGRIPSDRGYRLYVDSLMKRQDIAPDMENIIVGMLKQKINKMDQLLEETAKLVSAMTNYATIASAPSITETKIKHLQLVPVDEYSAACVIVTDTNIVRHQVIATHKPLDNHLCLVLSNILNEMLKQASLSEITGNTTALLQEKMLDYKDVAVDVVEAIVRTLHEEDVNTIITRGMTNILDFQEFNDVEKAKQVLELLEQKPHLMKLLDQTAGSAVNITIGEENALEPMKQCSVVTTNFRIGGYSLGSIGIIGPTRMNYGQVVSILEHIAYYITNMLCDYNDS
ncbi:MAG: heat-inducible transcriptional repressor HrcA [Cellulosilyticaceae bacterium]